MFVREQDLQQSIGETIRAMRLDRRIKQYALARTIGVDPSTLHKIESGKQALTVIMLIRLAEALGVEYWHIIDGTEPSPIERAEDI